MTTTSVKQIQIQNIFHHHRKHEEEESDSRLHTLNELWKLFSFSPAKTETNNTNASTIHSASSTSPHPDSRTYYEKLRNSILMISANSSDDQNSNNNNIISEQQKLQKEFISLLLEFLLMIVIKPNEDDRKDRHHLKHRLIECTVVVDVLTCIALSNNNNKLGRIDLIVFEELKSILTTKRRKVISSTSSATTVIDHAIAAVFISSWFYCSQHHHLDERRRSVNNEDSWLFSSSSEDAKSYREMISVMFFECIILHLFHQHSILLWGHHLLPIPQMNIHLYRLMCTIQPVQEVNLVAIWNPCNNKTADEDVRHPWAGNKSSSLFLLQLSFVSPISEAICISMPPTRDSSGILMLLVSELLKLHGEFLSCLI